MPSDFCSGNRFGIETMTKNKLIEINLLPEEMRKQKGPAFKLDIEMGKVKILAGAGVAGVLIFLIAFFMIGTSIRRKQVLNLSLKEQNLASQKSEAEKINNELSILKAKLNTLDQITKREFLWAEKIDKLADIVLPGVWFTRVYTDFGDKFIIEGSVISKKEEAMALVGKFMKNMKEYPSFFENFKDIKLESVQRKSTEERDIVDFKIVLYFKS